MIENIGTSSSNNYLDVAAANLPSTVRTDAGDAWGDMTGLAWIYAPLEESALTWFPWMFLNGINGTLGVFILTNSNDIRARYRVGTNTNVSLGTDSWKPGEWHLVSVTHQVSPRLVRITVRSESDLARASAQSTPGGELAVVDPLRMFGGSFSGAMMLYILDYVLTDAEFDDIYASRSPTAPLDTSLLSIPGGKTGVIYSPGLTVPSNVNNDVVAGAVPVLVGDAVSVNNYCVYHNEVGVTNAGDLRTPRAVVLGSTADHRHASPFEGSWAVSEWFQRRVTAGVDPAVSAAGVSPVARRLAMNAPSGVERVVALANSRGVRAVGANTSGLPRTLGENHAHGIAAELLSNVGGVENRVTTGVAAFFGVRGETFRTTGTVQSIEPTAAGVLRSYTRFWTGNGTASSGGAIAPGTGVHVAASSSIAPGFRQETGSLLLDANNVVETIRYLLFPGAGEVTFQPNFSSSHAGAGSNYGESTAVDCNTQVMATSVDGSYTIGDNTMGITSAQLAAWSLVQDGHACHNLATGEINMIASIELTNIDEMADTCDVAITFEYDWLTNPVTTNGVSFGPVAIATTERTLPNSAGSNQRRRVVCTTDSAGPAVLLSWWTHVPGENQWVIVSAGWSGNGLGPQRTSVSDADFARMVEAMDPGLWLLIKAEQGSSFPADLVTFTDDIRAEQPGAEIVWLSPIEVGNTGFDTASISNAAANDVIAASAWPFGGDEIEQFADGLRADSSHFSHRGEQFSAATWLTQLGEIAEPDPGEGAGRVAQITAVLRGARII